MKKHADIMRPKFESCNRCTRKRAGRSGDWFPGSSRWEDTSSPLMPWKAVQRQSLQKAKEAGLVMTGAGATYPYGKDPHDSNIRIAPSYPTPEELAVATDIFCAQRKNLSASTNCWRICRFGFVGEL